MKLHSSMLGTFFVYTLALSMPILKKKPPRRFLEKMPKLFIVVKWISDTVLSNFHCYANLADTAANLVHNTKKLFNVKLYY